MGIAIIGMAPGRKIPEDCELWGMSWDAEWTKMDVLFDIHRPEKVDDWITERNKEIWVPFYMQDNFYPNVTKYPLEKIIEIGRDYFTCSIAYILALAIHKKIKDIVVCGVSGTENYIEQRPCIEYWVGIAEGRGLKVTIQDETKLFSGDRYGY